METRLVAQLLQTYITIKFLSLIYKIGVFTICFILNTPISSHNIYYVKL